LRTSPNPFLAARALRLVRRPATAAVPAPAQSARSWRTLLWLVLLFISICFEGLGRKFMPQVPSTVFYFTKDAILLAGILVFGIPSRLVKVATYYFGIFLPFLVLAFMATVVQMFNPEHQHFGIAVVGLRAYWLWWLAPLVVAGAIREEQDRRNILTALACVAIVVAVFGAVQYTLPEEHWVNTYALYEGKVVNEVDVVVATGRVRISSTFSYLSGFVAFAQTVPVLLLSMGLSEKHRRTRYLCLAGCLMCLATLPMSGSRGAMMFVGASLAAVTLGAGAFRTQAGRRIIFGSAFAILGMFLLSREAIEGVLSRFSNTAETGGRMEEGLTFIPFFTIQLVYHPFMGIGTGMMQNAASVLGLVTPYYCEGEPGRYLVELGVIGYFLFWFARLGLAYALARMALTLRRHNQGAVAGAAAAFSLMAVIGKLTFDHVYQALYFIGVGVILHAVSRLPLPGQGKPMPVPSWKKPRMIMRVW